MSKRKDDLPFLDYSVDYTGWRGLWADFKFWLAWTFRSRGRM